jgi:hypothetical protein
VVHRECLVGEIVVRQHHPGLEAHHGVAPGVEGVAIDRGGGLEHGVHVARLHPRLEHEVVAELRVDERRPAGERGQGVHHRRQRLPRHAHARAAVLRERARFRHHRDHRLALPHRLVHRERILGRGLHARVVLQHADPRLAAPGQLAPGHHHDHARQRRRLRGVDGRDARVGVG